MESLKEKAEFVWENNKKALIVLGITWKIFATMIMVEKCKGPEYLPDTIKQKVEFINNDCDEGTR